MKDPIVEALELQENRRWLIAGLLLFSVVLGIALGSAWGGFLALLPGCGVIGSVAVWNLVGKVNLNDENFAGNAKFSSAAQEFASRTVAKYVTQLQLVSAGTPFLAAKINNDVFIITPKRYWLRCDGKSSTGGTEEIRIKPFGYKNDTTDPRETDEIISSTWEYATMSGDRDHRYKDNWRTYTVVRYGIILQFPGSSPWEMRDLSEDAAIAAFESFLAIGGVDIEWLKEMKDENQENKNEQELDRLVTEAKKSLDGESARKVEDDQINSLINVMTSRRLGQTFLKSLQAESPQTRNPKQFDLKVGDRVIGKWANGLWYPGTVAEVKDHQFVVHFDDGDEDTLPMEELKLERDLKRLSFTVGDRVIGKWSDGIWYPGEIAEVKGHQFVVHFDDGDEDTLSLKELKLEDGLTSAAEKNSNETHNDNKVNC